MITVGLTVAYDQTKEEAKRYGVMHEGFALHLLAALISGTTASVLCAPMDVVKSRVMAAPDLYSGWLPCLMHIARTEGAAGLFQGLGANICRLCPAIAIQLPVMEQMRILAGLEYFGVQ